MKNKFFFRKFTLERLFSITAILLLVILFSCKETKEFDPSKGVELPAVESLAVLQSTIGANSATVSFTITSDGGCDLSQMGICWSTSINPTLTLVTKNILENPAVGSFNADMTNLEANTDYYVRAFVSNAKGRVYSNEVPFKTGIYKAPTLGATSIKDGLLFYNKATLQSSVVDPGDKSVTRVGICWSTTENPIIEQSNFKDITEPLQKGTFDLEITGLTANTTYYVRSYAQSGAGTGYSGQFTFDTENFNLPVLSNVTLDSKNYKSARLKATVTSAGDAAVLKSGICWSTEEYPTVDSPTKWERPGTQTVNVEFTADLMDLKPATTYYVRAYGTNDGGTGYSVNQYVLTTDNIVQPVLDVLTIDPNSYTYNGVTAVVTILSAGDELTLAGVCYGTNPMPTLENSMSVAIASPMVGATNVQITNLRYCTTYYARAYAGNVPGGIVYSPDPVAVIQLPLAESLKAYAPAGMLIGGTMETPRGTDPVADKLVEDNYNAIQIPVYGTAYSSTTWTGVNSHNLNALTDWDGWANSKGIASVGHFLVGVADASYMPQWFRDGTYNAAELDEMLENRIKTVIQSMPHVTKWVVMNEPFTTGNAFVENKWYTMGLEANKSTWTVSTPTHAQVPVYIRKAFEYARKYAPTAELILCERGFERTVITDARVYSINHIVSHLKNSSSSEYPNLIDAVAIQGHHNFTAIGGWEGTTAGGIRWDLTIRHMNRFKTDFGVKVYFNEVDVAAAATVTAAVPGTTAYTNFQITHYLDFLQAIVECWYTKDLIAGNVISNPLGSPTDGIFFWGLGDVPGGRLPSLYNDDHSKKPAYIAVRDYFAGMSCN